MKHPFLLLLLACCFAVHTHAQELPLLGQLPQLGRDWVLLKQDAKLQPQEPKRDRTYEYSYAAFTNSKTGDLMSFAANRYANITRSVGSNPVRESALDMFPGGLPQFMLKERTRWGVAEAIRFNVVTVETGVEPNRKNIKAEALEYSFVYENEADQTIKRLGHGYALAFGDTVVFIQHTSAHIIISEDAMSAAQSVLRNHSSSRAKP